MLALLSLVSTCETVVQQEGANSMCLLREHLSSTIRFPLRFPYLRLDALAPERGKKKQGHSGK